MTDIFTKEKRSAIMAKVKSKNTGPEIKVRKFLFSKGFRFRVNDKRYPGTPDIVLPKYKTIIFVHGCFWHGHEGCSLGKLPKSRIEYWKTKIENNKKRDSRVREQLEADGWKVIVIWYCQLRTEKAASVALEELIKKILEQD